MLRFCVYRGNWPPARGQNIVQTILANAIMKRLHRWIRNYFGFTQRETNGFILFLLILALIAAMPYLAEQADEPYNPAADQQILDSLAAQLHTQPYSPYRQQKDLAATTKPIPPELLKPFDPNKISQAQWEQFGLPAYIAQRLIKYRTKANGFKNKGQIKRIYGFPPGLFAQLEPFMQLPDDQPRRQYTPDTKRSYPDKADYSRNSKPAFARKPFQLTPFDINTADTTQLKKIRGIGSKLSKRIVKFRDKLGGFGNIGQLQEVYGLPAEVVDSLRKYCYVSESFQPQKLNLNEVTFEQLRQHPYVGFGLARHIIAYRTQHGPFQSIEELQKIKTIDAATFQKISRYFSL